MKQTDITTIYAKELSINPIIMNQCHGADFPVDDWRQW